MLKRDDIAQAVRRGLLTSIEARAASIPTLVSTGRGADGEAIKAWEVWLREFKPVLDDALAVVNKVFTE